MSAKGKNNGHVWIVTFVAIVIAGVIYLLFPQHKSYSGIVAGFAAGHLILVLAAIFAGWVFTPVRILNKFIKRRKVNGYDFGWSPKWLYGFLLASLSTFLIAVYVYFSIDDNMLRFVVYTLLLLLALNFFIGNFTVRNSGRTTLITLPMVNLLANGGDKVLDAGCGAGRTSIAVAEAFQQARLTAFDKFDAGYIDEGGMELLKRNIKIAGIENRIEMVSGDITKTPFKDNQFDAVVSSFMIDHLQNGKKQALKESFRIMKPGGRFLMVIIVPGFSAFSIANVLSLMLTSRKKWIRWIEQTGFKMLSNGNVNEGAYFFFEKPFDVKQ